MLDLFVHSCWNWQVAHTKYCDEAILIRETVSTGGHVYYTLQHVTTQLLLGGGYRGVTLGFH